MKESGWKQRSSEATTTRRRDDSIRGQNGVRNWGELVQEPRAAVSSFQISGRYRVYARQGSAKRVESRAKGTSFCLTADCPDPFSLSSSFLRLSFSSLSSSLTIPPPLSDFALSFSLYAHRSSHLRPPSTLSCFLRASASRFRQGVNGEQYLDLDLREISRNSVGTSSVLRRRNLLFRRSVTLVQLAEIEPGTNWIK